MDQLSSNILLSVLPGEARAALQPHLARVDLPRGFVLQEPGRVIEWIYFPEDGVVSIVHTVDTGKPVEVAIFGREGMSGTALVLGANRAPYEVYMQVQGRSGLRIAAAEFRRVMVDHPALASLMLKYVQATVVQSASSTAAAATRTIVPRLARWLLMCHDRLSSDCVNLSHESMSMMLSTRRAGVTTALQALEKQGLVATRRRTVLICDRVGLEQLAGSSYGIAEAEYLRLIGAPVRDQTADQDRLAAGHSRLS